MAAGVVAKDEPSVTQTGRVGESIMRQGFSTEHVTPDSERLDYVEVVFAKSLDEAGTHRTILAGRGIPALIESLSVDRPSQCGVAVLVPQNRLIEASEILTMNVHDNAEKGCNTVDNEDYDELEEETECLAADEDDSFDIEDGDREDILGADDGLYEDADGF